MCPPLYSISHLAGNGFQSLLHTSHYKERLMFLNFVFAILWLRCQLLILSVTHLDSCCIVLHLYETSQDHSGKVILVQELNAENHRSKKPCTSAQHSNYLAIFLFSFYINRKLFQTCGVPQTTHTLFLK